MKFLRKPSVFGSLLLVSVLLGACSRNVLNPNNRGGGGSGGGGGSSTTFTIGGTVSSLSGSGLVLQDNLGDNLTVTANGTFTFATALASGKSYSVTVLTQPSNPTQTCTVTGGSGTAMANVTSVLVSCANGAATVIGGQVTGLLGSGLVLQNNGGDNLSIKTNGGFTFATPISSGATYNVTVLVQPTTPSQTCTVGQGTGTATGTIGNIVVTCSAGSLTVGGFVSGLAGTGMVLQDNGGDNLTVSANGTFQFPTLLVSGSNYTVTILTQPTGPVQTCTISSNTGTATANVTNVQIVCPAVFHTIGGEIVGLNVPTGQIGNGVLQDNGGDDLPVTGNGAFTFVTPIANGSAYDVSIFVQPTTQTVGCTIWGWSGIAVSNVTDIQVDCGHNDWAWMDGANKGNQDAQSTTPPVDHTLQDNDTPGGTNYAASWTDLNGNLWLFSGASHAKGQPNVGEMFNTMWEYTGTQFYFGGLGNFWTLTVPSGSTPLPRWGAVTWTDPITGDLWLFGGQGGGGFLSDLWSYNIGASAWTFHGGSVNLNGVYGTKGTANLSNFPGGRWGATGKVDASGTFWLFGGFGFDGTSANPGLLNDLWKYSGGQWTWVSDANTVGQNGVYGVQGTASASNIPGARQTPVSWIDNSGNFLLFGGYTNSPTGQPDAFNDLWQFSPTSGQWTWLSGANVVNQTATYGTQGVAASTNVPGARWAPAAFTDASGNPWLYGGFGFDATANGTLTDLWEYKGGQWIWVKGPNSVSQAGVYGIQPNPTVWPHVPNYPGSRWGAAYWTAPNGFWLFGGEGFDSSSGSGSTFLNDLWRYLPYP